MRRWQKLKPRVSPSRRHLRSETLPQLATFDAPQDGETGRAKAAGSSGTAELLDVAICSGLEAKGWRTTPRKRQYLTENDNYDVTKDPQIFAFPYKYVS